MKRLNHKPLMLKYKKLRAKTGNMKRWNKNRRLGKLYAPLLKWWRRNDRRYGIWWRLANGVVVAIFLVSIVIPVVQQLVQANSYQLSADALNLVGSTDQTLTKQLTYDASTQTYQFNKDAVKSPSASSNPFANLQSQVGDASGAKKDKSLYALDVPQDFSKGVTYHDINSQLSFSLIPQFTASQGKEEQGHLVFPLSGGNQAIYTLKNNGLKEDVVVPKATSDTMTLSYTLDLPSTLQAKVIPNSDGNIGIYSADPALFGNISYGSAADQAAVEKARENSPKTYLVFGLPSPVIKAPDGGSVDNASARFQLDGTNLSVIASGLTSTHGPITIDPSVVITSTSDFQTGNNEGDIDFSTSGQITRGGLTGGGVAGSGWTTTGGSLSASTAFACSVAYDGYMYELGGFVSGTGAVNTVQYSTINSSNGTLGGWSPTTSLLSPRTYGNCATYNGYIYYFDGYDNSTHGLATGMYAPINAGTGVIGTWQATTSNPTGTETATTVAYNGYMYMAGGYGGGYLATIQYAPINADGSITTWATSATSFSNGRQFPGFAIYNGFAYIVGGQGTSFVNYNDVQYAPVNSNGTIGSWTATTSFTTAREAQLTEIYNGYIYVVGGAGSSTYSDTQYAPINANGTVGAWLTSSVMPGARASQGNVIYNGYIYMVGGCASFSTSCSSGNYIATTYYAKIDPAGSGGTYLSGGNTGTNNRYLSQSVAYNGYLYTMGGAANATNSPVAAINGATINADGSLGTFSTTGYSTFTTAREAFAAFAYNGSMYVIGGCTSVTASCSSGGANNIGTVYKATIASGGGISGWTVQAPLPSGVTLYGMSAVVQNNTVYVIGGLSGTTFSSTIYYATMGTGGAISSWSTSSRTLSTATAFMGATAYGSELYIAGGCTAGAISCTTSTNNVYYAPIPAAGGDLSAALTSTNTFTNARGLTTLSSSNGYVYLTGGLGGTGSTYYADTQFAPINANGSLGTWVSSSGTTLTTLSSATSSLNSVAYNGYLYVSGGTTSGGTFVQLVQYTPLNNGGTGTVGTWSTLGNNLSGGRDSQAAVAYNGYLYLIGGTDGSNFYNDVQYAPLHGDGTIGVWHYTSDGNDDGVSFVDGFLDPSNTSSGLANIGAVAYNGYLYMFGGYNSTNDYNEVEFAPLSSNGHVGAWDYTDNSIDEGATFNATYSFANARDSFGYAVANGYLYINGGFTGSSPLNDTQYAKFNSNGTITTWTPTSNNFTTTRYGLSSIAYNGYLYVIGGFSGSTYDNDVQYALICTGSNSGVGGCSATPGDVGTWVATTTFNTGRLYQTAVAYDGYVYILGGLNSSTALNDIQYAPINSNGSIGNWTYTTSFNTPTRYTSSTVLYGGYMYVMGGHNPSSGELFDTQSAPVASMARVGQYSKLIDLGTTLNVTSVSYNGLVPTGAGAVTYKIAGANGIYTSSGLTNAIAGSGCSVGNATNTRYVFIEVTLDDSYGLGTGGAYADINGTNANLTDLTVSYNPGHPAPNVRLRGGQTLLSGTLSGFDTC